MKLKEVISHDVIDRAFNKMREPVKSRLRGDLGKYVFSLETIVDMLADSSSKSDGDFLSMMKQVERHVSRMAVGGAKRKEKGDEPENLPSFDKPGQAPKPEKGMPALPKFDEPGAKGQEKDKGELPSLAQLATKSTGQEFPEKPGQKEKEPLFKPLSLSKAMQGEPQKTQSDKEREYDTKLAKSRLGKKPWGATFDADKEKGPKQGPTWRKDGPTWRK